MVFWSCMVLTEWYSSRCLLIFAPDSTMSLSPLSSAVEDAHISKRFLRFFLFITPYPSGLCTMLRLDRIILKQFIHIAKQGVSSGRMSLVHALLTACLSRRRKMFLVRHRV